MLSAAPAKVGCILVCLDASCGEERAMVAHCCPRLEGIVLRRRDFGVLTVSVQAKKGLVTKKDRQAFLAARGACRASAED